jgi:hypothetical protein
MREEEKLAHDLYVVLGAQWNLPIFDNIARSEQRHMDRIAELLERYDIADPTVGRGIGEFTDATLQSLYDKLLAQGKTSAQAALQVGVIVEQTDIADLTARRTMQPDIQRVYDALTRGSQQHLRAFTANM